MSGDVNSDRAIPGGFMHSRSQNRCVLQESGFSSALPELLDLPVVIRTEFKFSRKPGTAPLTQIFSTDNQNDFVTISKPLHSVSVNSKFILGLCPSFVFFKKDYSIFSFILMNLLPNTQPLFIICKGYLSSCLRTVDILLTPSTAHPFCLKSEL